MLKNLKEGFSLSILQCFLNQSEDLIFILSSESRILGYSRSVGELFDISDSILDKNYHEICKLNNIPSLDLNNSDSLQILPSTIHSDACKKKLVIKWIMRTATFEQSKYMLLCGRDITKYEELKTKFETQDIYFNNLISQIPEYVFWKDCNQVYLGCNDYLAKQAGLRSRDDIRGLTDNDFGWSQERVEKLREMDLLVINQGKTISVEEVIPIPSKGIERVMITSKSPLRDKNGCIIGVLGISLDITESKETQRRLEVALEEAKSAELAKSYFYSACGHELRTPLTNIANTVAILEDDLEDHDLTNDEKEKYINIIKKHTEHLEYLIEDTICFSIEGSSQIKMKLEPIDLREVLKHVYETYQLPRSSSNTVAFYWRYPDNLSVKVIGDEARIKQVLFNLCNNALKFTEKGSIMLEALIDPMDSEFIRICIRDTGIGIDEDKISQVWDPLTQVHSELDDHRMGRYRGLGQGLSIVKSLVERMGGKVGVESKKGTGSTFHVTLPIVTDR